MGLDQDDMIANNQFRVSIGPVLFSFSKVTNLSDTIEYEPYQEGGFNDYPRLLKKPKTRMETLILEKGVRVGVKDIPMRALTTGMWVAAVVIMVMKHNRVVKSYFFEEGVITQWELGELNALGKEALIKRVVITHNGLHENMLML